MVGVVIALLLLE
jgi:ketosteroid isomerase-like protein